MKAVLISIKPKWCELIASGQKTVEVRKTKPKLETPFKVYIYQTRMKWAYTLLEKLGLERLAERLRLALGKVIGEFVCRQTYETGWILSPDHPDWEDGVDDESCLTERELYEYSNGGTFYGWNISDLVIYDNPKELRKFKRFVDRSKGQIYHEDMLYLQRPPQSWAYVEEVGR